jgi:hypothetical protein
LLERLANGNMEASTQGLREGCMWRVRPTSPTWALNLLDAADMGETLDQIVEYAKQCLFCDYVGIHIVCGREIEAAATSP